MSRTGIHWLAPATTQGALISGLIFAVGHHLFYQSLHGEPVSDTSPFDFGVSQQQINIAIGTTFAFLARACMVIAISTAFVQIFWHGTRSSSLETAPTLERIDAVYSTLENAFAMFNFRSWYTNPLLMLVAGLAWLVPIASVVTPATLSVHTAALEPLPRFNMRVPGLDFASMKLLAQMPDTKLPSLSSYQGPQPFYYDYAGPSDDLVKVANAVMGDGAVLPIEPPGLNASWQVQFEGPSLECSEVPGTVDFANGLVDYVNHSNNGGSGRQYGFVTWYSAVGAQGTDIPFGADCSRPSACPAGSDPAVLDLGNLVPPPTEATLNRTSKPLEMMVLTKSFQSNSGYNAETDPYLKLRRCRLYNATYQVSFNYSNGDQTVVATTTRDQSKSPIEHIPGVLHKYMNQETDYYEYPCTSAGASELRCCYNHPNLYQTLSYQAIMDVFTQTFQGAAYMAMIRYEGLPSGAGAGSTFFVNTTLMQTKLSQSKDLAYLRNALQSEPEHTGRLTLQAAVQTGNDTVIADADNLSLNSTGYSDSSVAQDGIDMSLSDAIEEVFRNLTVSLMSSAALQPNYSSPTAPFPVEVTFDRHHNVYAYAAHNLWLSYGIALGLTFMAVLAGLVTMFISQASYSGNFSTILRAAYGAQLSTAVSQHDANGRDPLPKYLANARVLLQSPTSESLSDQLASAPAVTNKGSKEATSTIRLLRAESQSEVNGVSHGRQGRA